MYFIVYTDLKEHTFVQNVLIYDQIMPQLLNGLIKLLQTFTRDSLHSPQSFEHYREE